MITSQKIAALLNEVLAADPRAMYYLSCISAPASQALIDHPSVVCCEPMPGVSGPAVRWTGLLQAIGAMDGHKIGAVYENGKLSRFEAITIEEFESRADSAERRP